MRRLIRFGSTVGSVTAAVLLLFCDAGEKPVGPDTTKTGDIVPVPVDSIPEDEAAGLWIRVDATDIPASWSAEQEVIVQAFDPEHRTPIPCQEVEFAVRAGVPHLCVLVTEPARVDVVSWGRSLRHDPRFAPEGVNVDFVARGATPPVPIRTYERGVEDETLACGSGAVAAALVLFRQQGYESPLVFETRSGERLEVDVEPVGDSRYRVTLGGPARLVYRGELP